MQGTICTLIGYKSNPNQGSANLSLLETIRKRRSAKRAELRTKLETVGGDIEDRENSEDLHLDGLFGNVLAVAEDGKVHKARLNRQCCEDTRPNV